MSRAWQPPAIADSTDRSKSSPLTKIKVLFRTVLFLCSIAWMASMCNTLCVRVCVCVHLIAFIDKCVISIRFNFIPFFFSYWLCEDFRYPKRLNWTTENCLPNCTQTMSHTARRKKCFVFIHMYAASGRFSFTWMVNKSILFCHSVKKLHFFGSLFSSRQSKWSWWKNLWKLFHCLRSWRLAFRFICLCFEVITLCVTITLNLSCVLFVTLSNRLTSFHSVCPN